MPATNPPSYVDGASYSARLDRIYASFSLASERPSLTLTRRRTGVAPGAFRLQSVAGWNATMGDGYGWLPALDGVGAYQAVAEGSTTVGLTPANASLERRDIVVAMMNPSGTNAREWGFKVIEGTAGSGSFPTPPDESVVLYEVTLPAGAPNLQTSYFQTVRRFAVAEGGIIPLRAGEAFPTHPYGGMMCHRLDEGTTYFYSETADKWSPVTPRSRRFVATPAAGSGGGRDVATIVVPDQQGHSYFVTATAMCEASWSSGSRYDLLIGDGVSLFPAYIAIGISGTSVHLNGTRVLGPYSGSRTFSMRLNRPIGTSPVTVSSVNRAFEIVTHPA